jgi:hypothetical protein
LDAPIKAFDFELPEKNRARNLSNCYERLKVLNKYVP